MARLLLGVSGGIAAYKTLEFVRLATKAGHVLRVIQTEASQRFVGAASFEGLTGSPVLVTEWERDPMGGAFPDQPRPDQDPLAHLELVANADAFLIAPASANTLAKLAGGHADNLLSAAALAATCPVLVAPAMNNHMYEHPATQANLETLEARGVHVLSPDTGALGSRGEWGTGRLREPADLLAACEALVPTGGPRPLDGLRVLITAGGTREAIDSVRYVGNRSSGRMGFALADEAAARGANVTVIAANVQLPRNPAVLYADVTSAAELKSEADARFEDCDLLLMAAAVADFRPVAQAGTKIKKEGRDALEIALEATDDVLSGLSARRRPGQVLVGFAAEDGAQAALSNARGKLERKGLDLVVGNDISRQDIGFEGEDNEVVLVDAAQTRTIPRASKGEVAGAILDAVSEILSQPRYNPADGAPGAAGSGRP